MEQRGRRRRTPASRLGRGVRPWVALSAGVVWAVAAVATAAAQAAWLDAPPQPWNTPGASVPAAPPPGGPVDPQCAARERAPAGPEETQVAGAGWRLQDFWPTQRVGGLAVVVASSGYDGMCRPTAFTAAAFADGQFAGTLSPVLMDSRADGALFDLPTIGPDGRITATFVRYAPTDPLCCPSRPRTDVVYRLEGAAGSRVVVPERIATGVTPPAQLPRTGDAPVPPIAWIGGVAVLAGLVLRWAALRGVGAGRGYRQAGGAHRPGVD